MLQVICSKAKTETTEGGAAFMNAGMYIIAIFGGAVGIFSTLYLVISLPAVIIWKIYRHFRFGYSWHD